LHTSSRKRERGRRAAWLFPALLAAACGLLSSCSQKNENQQPVVTVQVSPARRTTIERVVQGEGVLYPIHEAVITPKISAPVKKFLVQRGDHVRLGQLLAVLENKDVAAAAVENEGAYDQAQANYEAAVKGGLPEEWQKAELDVQAAKQALEAAQKIYLSRQKLFQEGALPRKELDQAQVAYVQSRNQYDLAKKHLQTLQAGGKQLQLEAAKGQLESAKGRYQGSQAQLHYTEVRSPIAGVVTDRPLYRGELAAAGTPLITVMDISQVVARAHIPQEQAALLKVGDPGTISAADSAARIAGKVTVVSPALDPNSTTVEVWVQAPNPGDKMRPGGNVQVELVAGTVPDAIVVPQSALLKSGEGAESVMVVGKESRAYRQPVKVGVRQGNQAQIVSGLSAGETVITKGAFGLPDNTRVKVESEPATTSRDGRGQPAAKD
jgi:HlyD family secretion protein